MARKYVYMATLDRFGYDLIVIDTTEEKAIEAIKAEYIRAFMDMNGIHPDDEECDWGSDGRTWLEMAMEDISVEKMTLGKVEWS